MNLRQYVDKVLCEEAQKYYEIVFMQGDDAKEPLDILDDKGELAALEYLKDWDYGDEMDHSPEEKPWGNDDDVYEKDDYVMSYNTGLGYIGLVRKVKKEEEPEEKPEEGAEETATKEGRELSVPDKHQRKIALDTLKLSKVGASVLGGMNHKQAVEFLKKIGYSDEKLKSMLKAAGHSDEEIKGMM